MHLTAENLAARRGDDLIFVNISFYLAAGEALVLTGRNGSGKSTLLRVVAGLLRPEKGTVIFHGDGSRGGRHPGEVCHYLGHRNAMKNELTVAENLDFWSAFLGETDAPAGLPLEAAAEAVGLSGITHLPFGYLSAGQQRRFAFAKLLVSHRPVWILDEPTAALDASADRLFAGLIEAHLAKGGIVLAATHQPLGLKNVQELKMTGFAGVDQGVWG
ncbi:heme ABC exporter ATP-binding protein CcmA [Rhizobium croatiense]|uniref:Heme ABC exporter ATP-binding protein CcmA n=1 Tax=Rhizobium croatiense TaxID=2867516 RepID=A0ABS7M6Z4_9HYPH|nr:heme ABC exporter ATP-binding protein CcmA [Rhizobium croatiense]MBY4632901.1 heme ABC exporter ATP-binding protein CcmA [Rhizobium croatiense]